MRLLRSMPILGMSAFALTLPALADDTGFAYSHDLQNEGGKNCFVDHFHTGTGDGASKDSATKAAIRSWVDFTNFEYGSDWARWSKAAGKKTSFTKAEKGWTATVDARPCK